MSRVSLPLNSQTTLPLDLREDGRLQVHSLFLTIQGEGPFAGQPAVFLRLYGCNLRCPLCDTDYTSRMELLEPAEILKRVLGTRAPDAELGPHLVVITGGEPLRQNIVPTVRLLLSAGLCVQLETNGSLSLPGLPWDDRNLAVVVSPKTPKIHPDIAAHATCYKYLIRHGHIDTEDGLPTDVLGLHLSPARPTTPYPLGLEIYVQPADDRDPTHNRLNTQEAVRVALKYDYRLSLQLHKILGIE